MVMGRIMAPYGIKGWVKVQTYSEDKLTLLDYDAWWIRPRSGPGAVKAAASRSVTASDGWAKYPVASSREHGATLVAQLAGIDDREAAAALKGADVGVLRSALPAAAEGEIYYDDLVGLEVINLQGTRLGRVSKVQDFGAHPVLCVVMDKNEGAAGDPTKGATAVERMIPFVDVYVQAIDVAAGRIDVDWQLDY